MNSVNFYNLEQLSLTVRDPNTRTYTEEAIRAYQAGANRPAIIGMWTAVTYDLIQKIRELDNAGEGSASIFIQKFDQAIKQKDIGQLLRIEDSLIEKALNEFEMLQPHEAVALERLREDRHLCAHPAMVTGDVLFQPTSEAVHTHIVHAIVYLFQHQPMQGKSALERMCQDISVPSFPSDVKPASKYLAERYLNYAKPSLFRNWIVVLVKKLLIEEETDNEDAFIVALKATFDAKRLECTTALKAVLPTLVPKCRSDKRLLNIFVLIDLDKECWAWIDEATRIKLCEILKSGSLSTEYTSQTLSGALEIDELAASVTSWFESSDLVEKIRVFALKPLPRLIPMAMKLYADSGSYKTAQYIGNNIIFPLVGFMSSTDIINLLNNIRENNQIREASDTPQLLCKIFDMTASTLPQTRYAWQEFISFVRSMAKDPSDYYAYPKLAEKIQGTTI